MGDFDCCLPTKVTSQNVSVCCVNLWFSVIFSVTVPRTKIPHMEVLDIAIRNLFTLFGLHSFQSPVAPGVFVPLDMAKKTTSNFVFTYAITSILGSKWRQYNTLHDDISFEEIQ